MDVWWVQRNLSFTRLLPAALWEESDNRGISSTARNLSELELSMERPGSYSWDILRLQLLLPLSSSTVLPYPHSSRIVALELLIWSLAAVSFIPAAEFEKENLKSSISLKTDAASVLSR